MTYYLGVDLGTSYTAAAIYRAGRAEMIELGTRSTVAPSVLYLATDASMLAGDSATRRALTESDRVAREFKRRLGDPTPILLAGSPFSAEALTARLLRWVIERVTEVEAGPPAGVCVTHPANWGPFKLDLLRNGLHQADVAEAIFVPEPVAAAVHHATLEPVQPGMSVAVFDLGGGTFDAVVLRKTEASFEILGEPEGIERLGGVDFDEAVFGFVRNALGGAFDELDESDASTRSAVARLREECVAAKEALSTDTEAVIPVGLPNVQTDLRITRAEFEGMIRPRLADAVDALGRAVRSADLKMDDVDLVLLVGGSSRIPLVGQMLAGEPGQQIAAHAHPKHVVALGAARLAAEAAVVATHAPAPAVQEPPAEAVPVATHAPAPVNPQPSAEAAAIAQPVASSTPPPLADAPAPPAADRTTTGILIGAVALLALVGFGLFALLSRGESTTEVAQPDQTVPTEVQDNAAAPAAPAVATLAPTVAPTEVPTAVPTVAPEPTATTVPTATAVPTATPVPVFQCAAGLCTHIESATLANGEFLIEWSAHGFDPALDNFHAHFFYNVFEPIQVGTNFAQFGAVRQGSWQLTADQPFNTAGSSVAVGSAPAGTTQICVVAADSGHGVANPENAECVDIPAELQR